MDARDAEFVLNRLVLVAQLAGVGVDDDGAVVSGDKVFVAFLTQRRGDALDLPGRRRAGRVVVLPGDVDLEGGTGRLVEGVGEAGHAHCAADIGDDGRCAGVEDGNLGGLRLPGRGGAFAAFDLGCHWYLIRLIKACVL
jgi:hypothetical protein